MPTPIAGKSALMGLLVKFSELIEASISSCLDEAMKYTLDLVNSRASTGMSITAAPLNSASRLIPGLSLVTYHASMSDYPSIFKNKYSTCLLKTDKYRPSQGQIYCLQTIYPCSTDAAATGCMALFRVIVMVNDTTVISTSPWRSFSGTAYDEAGEIPGPIELTSIADYGENDAKTSDTTGDIPPVTDPEPPRFWGWLTSKIKNSNIDAEL